MSISEEQLKLWNGPSAHAWVEAQEFVDSMFKPLESHLLEPLAAGSSLRVLDVGCGTGGTTLAAAQRIGAGGHCVGVDISGPMLAHARRRAEQLGVPVSFVCASAQTHAFEAGSFDRVLSRFGVMFFESPVQAFANLRHALSSDGRMHIIVWRSPAENPFMTAVERAIGPLLPNVPPRVPDAPGPFALADQQRLRRILGESGWSSVDVQRLDVECVLPVAALELYSTRFGPVGIALQAADEETRRRIAAAARAAFDPFLQGDEVRYTAACWSVMARP